jgi:hypothetical protein
MTPPTPVGGIPLRESMHLSELADAAADELSKLPVEVGQGRDTFASCSSPFPSRARRALRERRWR